MDLKTIVRSFILCICAAFSFAIANGQKVDPAIDWAKANALYQEGNYEGASVIYERMAESGLSSAALYYNLANAYYKLNKVGPAILNYERSLKLSPDATTMDNLALARQRIIEPIQGTRPIFFVRWWTALNTGLSPNLWAGLALFFFIVPIALLYLRLGGSKKIPYWGRWFAASLALLLVASIFALSSYWAVFEQKEAIVLHGSALLEKPEIAAKPLIKIPEGTCLQVHKEENGYWLVSLPNGRRGWVGKSTASII